MVGADRAEEIHVLGSGQGGDVCSEGLGDLDGERAHAATGPIDHDPLPRLDLRRVAQTLERRTARHRNGRGLLERQRVWLQGEAGFGGRRILGERPAGDAEHLIAGPESRDLPAAGFDDSGHVPASDARRGSAEKPADDVGQPS